MMVSEKIKELIAEQIGVDVEEITDNKSLEDLGIDSLDVTEIAMSIEDEFDIEFEADTSMKTVADLIAAVEAKVG
ncbi:MAG: acyl carrier protein [Clostridia bacterium]|nr:acyl carrier protein [Clostridia bacterium]MBQ2152541.1 acyl carrier protein [Clostridia bacterium]MBQ2347110.1 acyl carrier protein [Clostridia bacterium]